MQFKFQNSPISSNSRSSEAVGYIRQPSPQPAGQTTITTNNQLFPHTFQNRYQFP